ncbi:HYR domain-containing protein [Crocinitomix catalasitica]|nr:HYR domain-containing protein [Crocinitomix catalasitica]
MKHYLKLLFLLLPFTTFSQTTLWQESFEVDGEGSTYFSTSPFFSTSNDYFTRVTGGGTSPAILVECVYTSFDGTAFWATEDTDDVGGDGFDYKAVVFAPVATAGYDGLTFRGLFAIGRCPADLYDMADGAVVSYSTDGGGSWIQGVKFRFDDLFSDGFNETIGSITTIDPTCLISTTNGGFAACSSVETPPGGGNIASFLNSTFQELTFSIPGTPASVIIRIEMSFESANEEFAFDNFRVEGDFICTDPDVPTLVASPSTVCPGGSSTITITGALNSATDWQVYTTSCGVGLDGSTATSTYAVTPATTTTYYIRGEGGCIVPGACGSVTINADDVTAPVFTTCPGDQNVSADASCDIILADYTGVVVVTDDCDASPTISQLPLPGTTVSGAGTVQTVTVTALDANGNSSTCIFDVTVVDDTDPVISGCPADISVPSTGPGCTENVSWTEPTVSDNCSGATITGSHTPGASFNQGITVVTYTGVDGSGNTATCVFNITVTSDLASSATSVDEIGGSDGSIDLTVTGGAGPFTFDWDNDGTGDFDDSEDLTGLTGGTYTVIIMDANGCTDTLVVVVDSQVGLDELIGVSLLIYPNPASNQITITIGNADLQSIQLFNSVGQLVYSQVYQGTMAEIELSDLERGLYLVRVNTSVGLVHRQIVLH